MSSTPRATLGVIGGSGLYELDGLGDVESVRLETPFGPPSDEYVLGTAAGCRIAFLPRHGRGHRLLPTELNFRANIHGMKQLGVSQLLSVGAVGSLREEIAPGHVVVPDQFIDRTFDRHATFFGGGVVAHVQLGDPVCSRLAAAVTVAARGAGATLHEGGTYVCMEGPQFSTRAESNLYRAWGADVIGMTNLTEARLAREAEMCYASLAFVTDYDCWREATEDVSVEVILAILAENSAGARRALADAVARIDPNRGCGCRDAMRYGIITDPRVIPDAARERLRPIIGRYL